MSVETGFELAGKFWMTPDDPQVMDAGFEIYLTIEGIAEPVKATVTKAYLLDGRKYIHFATGVVTAIQPAWMIGK